MALKAPASPADVRRGLFPLDAIRELVTDRLAGRLARLRRWRRETVDREAIRERAIADVISAAWRTAQSQPGLFDRRHIESTDLAQANAPTDAATGTGVDINAGPAAVAVAIGGWR